MNIKALYATLAITFASGAIFTSCNDDLSQIGQSLTSGELTITLDSIETKLATTTIWEDGFDARTTSKLLGRINIPEYGKLDCSFVSQLLPSTYMNIPDSITVNEVDSMRVVLTVPRGSLTGDSLAPQQLKLYRLTQQLPSDISNSFDPSGYYDPSSPLGVKSYTLSAIAMKDSLFRLQTNISIPIRLPDQMATDVFTAYKENPNMFAWPQTFSQEFPGVYIEQNFGNGCIGLISSMRYYLYWHYNAQKYQKNEETEEYEYVPVLARDSVCLFASQPEVLSSNIIKYEASDYLKNLVESGKPIITTPGGYQVNITFPAQDIIDKYNRDLYKISVVSQLSFEIPASAIKNDFNLDVAPHLLMIRTSERDEFFRNNKVPDGKTSFYAAYNSEKGKYSFNGMRNYILDLINSGEPISPEDMEFSLVPVIVTTEDVAGYTSTTTYVTSCSEYIGRPTLTQLDTDKAIIVFSFSKQEIN